MKEEESILNPPILLSRRSSRAYPVLCRVQAAGAVGLDPAPLACLYSNWSNTHDNMGSKNKMMWNDPPYLY